MKTLPIGFIDSGFGGLTVVKQSLKQLPTESIIYLGDSARCPYGPRTLEEVKSFIWQMTDFLMEKGIKMLVIACNTGTAAALDEIRSTLMIPVIGVIHPGSRAAIKETNNHKIGVIGTEGTISSHLYERVIMEKAGDLEVFSRPVPEFVDIVEKNEVNLPETLEVAKLRLAPFVEDEVDTLVLGCTHYPLLSHLIQKVVGPQVKLIDSGVETINEVSTLLDYFGLSRSQKEAREVPPTLEIFTTGDTDHFAQVARVWLQNPQLEINKCEIVGEKIVQANCRKS